ncbi:DedA family protein [Wenjunlia tyrosinilytica]|uniref:VTT domain-containing protein n=1 Tax=Wenjunlia tyrosinilytica TaxID=1544741 RepID=A0A918DVN1_9ACTN|nr:VTT domain-containing protein [Wenjunlia tyrosinilytica]GGO85413.1 hypothetical protein GCM10012280_19130 [Wenjunlia tyrosinilytica]
MFDQLGDLLSSPWVYALVGASVLLDVFLPVLPSGALLVAAATAGSAGNAFEAAEIATLLLCAATASCLGDLAAYRMARSGSVWFERRMDKSRRLAAARERLGEIVEHGGGALVVLARFAPAGRSIVSIAAGVANRKVAEFLPWSALAGVAWAGYSVGIGYLGGQWLGASWLTTGLSFCALLAAGSMAARVFRREGAVRTPLPAGAEIPAPAGPVRPGVPGAPAERTPVSVSSVASVPPVRPAPLVTRVTIVSAVSSVAAVSAVPQVAAVTVDS